MPTLSNKEYNAVVDVINAARYFLCVYPNRERYLITQATWDLRDAMARLGNVQMESVNRDNQKEG